MNSKYFYEAYKQALKAYKKNEVPVGSVIVQNKKIIARGYNKRIKNNIVISHAEINTLIKAQKKLKDWRLDDCDLYVTLKPCSMCEKIINQSRIRNVYYLVDKKFDNKEYNKTKYKQMFEGNKDLEYNYKELLSDFFKNIR